MYIAGDGTLQEIADKVGVPYGTLHGWHTTEKWADKRRQIRAKLFDEWKQNAMRESAEGMIRLVSAQLRAAMLITDRVKRMANGEDLDSTEVCRLARALKESSLVVRGILEPVYGGAGE